MSQRGWAGALSALNVDTREAIRGLWAGNQHETLKFMAQKSGRGWGEWLGQVLMFHRIGPCEVPSWLPCTQGQSPTAPSGVVSWGLAQMCVPRGCCDLEPFVPGHGQEATRTADVTEAPVEAGKESWVQLQRCLEWTVA